MAEYKLGQKVLIKTSYRKDDEYVLAGRPGVIVERQKDMNYWDYPIKVQMPDGPLIINVRRSTRHDDGFILDTPENRKKYPIPNWEQLDLEDLHWPKLMAPAGIRVPTKAFDGFIADIAKACGGIDITGTDMNVNMHNTWRVGDMRSSETTIYVFPSPERAQAFLELLQWISWYGETKQATGVERGHNLLIQLNEGELAMGDFDQSVQSEKNRMAYGRNPWCVGKA